MPRIEIKSELITAVMGRREKPATWSSATHDLGEDLEADLLSLLIEKEFGITGYELRFEDGRLWQNDGRLFVEAIMERTLAEFSDPRFEAERLGWERLERMMREKEGVGGWFVIASPPGETYRFKGSKPMSATFLFKLEKDGKVRVFSVYEPEISVAEHWRRVTLTVPKDDWFELKTAEEVVATPVYVGGDWEMEVVLGEFGIGGVAELEKRVQVLEKKVLTKEARVRVTGILAKRLRELVPQGFAEIMDRVTIVVISAWVRGELSSWVEAGESFESWIDATIYQFLENYGYRWQAYLFAVEHNLKLKSQDRWHERWQELIHDFQFQEILLRGVHGSGSLSWLAGDSMVGLRLGLDPLGWRFKKEEGQKEQFHCPQCQHVFIAMKKGKIKCPKCGARLS